MERGCHFLVNNSNVGLGAIFFFLNKIGTNNSNSSNTEKTKGKETRQGATSIRNDKQNSRKADLLLKTSFDLGGGGES